MTSERTACLVLHGKAAMRDEVRAAVRAVRDEGFAIDVRVTWEAGDASRFAREAAEAGASVVIAGGGDGTVNEVVAGLVGGLDDGPIEEVQPARPTAALAVLPLGTANDLAHACGIPLDALGALRLAVAGRSVNVDVGRANGKCFLNVATGGFGAQLTVATPNEMKKIFGGAAYFLTGLTHFTSIRAASGRLTAPDFQWAGSFLVLAVGNGRQAGGGHPLCPDALLDDGLLDVRVLPHLSNDEIPTALAALLREGLDAVHHRLVHARVPWLEIETDDPLQINLDGEPIASTRFRFEVLPQLLPMKLPGGCPLVT